MSKFSQQRKIVEISLAFNPGRNKHALMLSDELCERARQARDPYYDGRFFIGVLTTGIYCRPVCPARMPKADNVRFFPTGASAQVAGFRPCKRCRPDTDAPPPGNARFTHPVQRALRMIDAGFLNQQKTENLATAVGLGVRQLNRLFQQELGSTPLAVARAVRVQLARRLIDNPGLKMTDVAMHAGFGSVRRFNDEFRAVYQVPPGEIKRRGGSESSGISLSLPVRAPYHHAAILEFLRGRSLQGVEETEGRTYRRCVVVNEGTGTAWVEAELHDQCLVVSIPDQVTEPVHAIVRRLRRIFDLDADGPAIDQQLREDPWLAPHVDAAPGLRVPGAWDGFETAVRAILGQQVSVARARDIAQALVNRFGAGQFPSAAVLADADVVGLGMMPAARCNAVRNLARAVVDDLIGLDECVDADELQHSLTSIKGIGPWTAGYIAMRIARDPDTFLDSDWVIRKALEDAPSRTQADAWRPWRAYAVMVLWNKVGSERQEQQRSKLNGREDKT